MNTKIKILCIILSLIYIALIAKSIVPMFEIFSSGVEMGKESVKKDTNYEVFHINVTPKKFNYTFPSVIKDERTGKEFEAEITGYKIKVESSSSTSRDTIMYVIKTIFAFIMLGLIIYLPILFFKVMKASARGNMLEARVIKRISRIGWSLIIMFIIEVFFFWSDLTTAKQLITLENYKMTMDFSNYYLLILGTVILLLSEVLKEALNMKEEQDLTI